MKLHINEIYRKLAKGGNPLIDQVSTGTVARNTLRPMNSRDVNMVPGKMIRTANEEVLIQSYKFDIPSEGYDEINKALIALRNKARETSTSITVYILINTRGKIPELVLKPNDAYGLRSELPEDDEFFKINVAFHKAEALGSYHSKLVITDGSVAVVRGGEPSKFNNSSGALVETGVRLAGNFVNEVRNDFVRSWNKSCKAEHKLASRTTSNLATESEGDIPVVYMSKKANGNPFAYKNFSGPFKLAFIQAIRHSKNTIKIVTPNLNDKDVIDALAEACNRGVSVQIIISKKFNDDKEDKLGGTNTQNLRFLLSRIYRKKLNNLNVRWSTRKDGSITEKKGEANEVHGKYACFDDDVVITGSSPLDLQGTMFSKEADIMFQDRAKAQEFNRKLFDPAYDSGMDFRRNAFENIGEIIRAYRKDADGNSYPDLEAIIEEHIPEGRDKITLFDINASYVDKTNVLLEHLIPVVKKSLSEKSYNDFYSQIKKELSFVNPKTKSIQFENSKPGLSEAASLKSLALTLVILISLVQEENKYNNSAKYILLAVIVSLINFFLPAVRRLALKDGTNNPQYLETSAEQDDHDPIDDNQIEIEDDKQNGAPKSNL